MGAPHRASQGGEGRALGKPGLSSTSGSCSSELRPAARWRTETALGLGAGLAASRGPPTKGVASSITTPVSLTTNQAGDAVGPTRGRLDATVAMSVSQSR